MREFEELDADWTEHVRLDRDGELIDVTVRSIAVGYIYATEDKYRMRKAGALTTGPDYTDLSDVWRALELRVEAELEREREHLEWFERERAPYLRAVSGLDAWE